MHRVMTGLVWAAAAINAGIGLASAISPALVLGPVGIEINSALADVELRAMYGGFELGMAVFLAWCALSPERVRTGLVAAVLTIGGLGLGRLLSWLVLQPPGLLMPALITVELGGALGSAWLLYKSASMDSEGSRLG